LAKIATADFYAHHILPEVALQTARTTSGAKSLAGLAL